MEIAKASLELSKMVKTNENRISSMYEFLDKKIEDINENGMKANQETEMRLTN